jgi:hypothetical protein
MQTISERFSQITDLNVIFVCCLVMPAEKNIMARLSDQAVRSKHGSNVATGHRYIGQGVFLQCC